MMKHPVMEVDGKPPETAPSSVDIGEKELPPLPSFEGDDHFHEDDKNHATVSQRIYLDSKIQVISHVVFVIAASIYVALEVTVLPYYQFYKDVPYRVREAETDDVWWQYYNDTDAFPDYLYNATDDYSWGEWYNNSFLDEEEELNEFLFKVPNADSKYAVSLNPDFQLKAMSRTLS
jgi:hypothetical protein